LTAKFTSGALQRKNIYAGILDNRLRLPKKQTFCRSRIHFHGPNIRQRYRHVGGYRVILE
jgi:hypothetical protein